MIPDVAVVVIFEENLMDAQGQDRPPACTGGKVSLGKTGALFIKECRRLLQGFPLFPLFIRGQLKTPATCLALILGFSISQTAVAGKSRQS